MQPLQLRTSGAITLAPFRYGYHSMCSQFCVRFFENLTIQYYKFILKISHYTQLCRWGEKAKKTYAILICCPKKVTRKSVKNAGYRFSTFCVMSARKIHRLGGFLCVFPWLATHLTDGKPFDPHNNPPSYLCKRVGNSLFQKYIIATSKIRDISPIVFMTSYK